MQKNLQLARKLAVMHQKSLVRNSKGLYCLWSELNEEYQGELIAASLTTANYILKNYKKKSKINKL